MSNVKDLYDYKNQPKQNIGDGGSFSIDVSQSFSIHSPRNIDESKLLGSSKKLLLGSNVVSEVSFKDPNMTFRNGSSIDRRYMSKDASVSYDDSHVNVNLNDIEKH